MDWISVDQAVQRALALAETETDRDAIRLAVENGDGPDPTQPGGGATWAAAVAAARVALAQHSAISPRYDLATQGRYTELLTNQILDLLPNTDTEPGIPGAVRVLVERVLLDALDEQRVRISLWLNDVANEYDDPAPIARMTAAAIRRTAGQLSPDQRR